jgi:hypothetical protein
MTDQKSRMKVKQRICNGKSTNKAIIKELTDRLL